jgi:hypothetical protein
MGILFIYIFYYNVCLYLKFLVGSGRSWRAEEQVGVVEEGPHILLGPGTDRCVREPAYLRQCEQFIGILFLFHFLLNYIIFTVFFFDILYNIFAM